MLFCFLKWFKVDGDKNHELLKENKSSSATEMHLGQAEFKQNLPAGTTHAHFLFAFLHYVV